MKIDTETAAVLAIVICLVAVATIVCWRAF